MTTRPRRHSVVGSAFGFGMAGAGLGFLWGGAWLYLDANYFAKEWVAAMRNTGGMVSYWYILKTIPAGWLFGTFVGVWFALRSRSKE